MIATAALIVTPHDNFITAVVLRFAEAHPSTTSVASLVSTLYEPLIREPFCKCHGILRFAVDCGQRVIDSDFWTPVVKAEGVVKARDLP